MVIVSNGNVRNCGEADEALELAKAGGHVRRRPPERPRAV